MVDKVIFFENGRIVEIGKYENLLENKFGAFWNFINLNKKEREIESKRLIIYKSF